MKKNNFALLSLFPIFLFLTSFPVSQNNLFKAEAAESHNISTDFKSIIGSGQYSNLNTTDAPYLVWAGGVSTNANETHGLIPGNWGETVDLRDPNDPQKGLLRGIGYNIDLSGSGTTFSSLTFSMNALLSNFDDEVFYFDNYFDIFVGDNINTTIDSEPEYRFCLYSPSDQPYAHQVASNNSFHDFDTVDLSGYVAGKNNIYIALVMSTAIKCSDTNKNTYMSGDSMKLSYIGTKLSYVSINYTDSSSVNNVTYNYDSEAIKFSDTPSSIADGQTKNITVSTKKTGTYIAYIKINGVYEPVDPSQTSYTLVLKGDETSQDINIEAKATSYGYLGDGNELTIDYTSYPQYDHSWACNIWSYTNLKVDNTNSDVNNRGLTQISTSEDGNVMYGIDSHKSNIFHLSGRAKITGSAQIVFSFTPEGKTKTHLYTLDSSQYSNGGSFDFDTIKFPTSVGFGLSIDLINPNNDIVFLNNLTFYSKLIVYPPSSTSTELTFIHGEDDLVFPLNIYDEQLMDIQVGRNYLATSEYQLQNNNLTIDHNILNTFPFGIYDLKIMSSGGTLTIPLTISDRINYPVKNNSLFTGITGNGPYNNLQADQVPNMVSITGGNVSCHQDNEHGLIPGNWEDPTAIYNEVIMQYVYYPSCPEGLSAKYNFSNFNINIVGYLNNFNDNEYHYNNYIEVYVGNDNTSTLEQATLVAKYSMYKDETTTKQINPSNVWQDFGTVDLTPYAEYQNTFKIFVVMHHASTTDPGHVSEYMENGKFKFAYVGTKIASITTNYTLTEDEVNIFIDEYMHPEISKDDNSDTGLCRGKNGYYIIAKNAFLDMTERGQNSFMNDDNWLDMRLRYEAWAITANDWSPYTKNSLKIGRDGILITDLLDDNDNNTHIIIGTAIGMLSAALIISVTIIRRKRLNK